MLAEDGTERTYTTIAGTPPPPGPVVCQQPYIIFHTPLFQGVAGERDLQFTQPTGFPLRVLALTTTLSSSDLQLRGARDEIWNEDEANVQVFAGRPEKVEIYRKLYAPYLLNPREVLRGDFTNVTGLDSGSVFYWCERVVESPPTVQLQYPTPYTLTITLTPNRLTGFTRTINQKFIVFGLQHDAGLDGSALRITDSFSNQQWSGQALPTQAFSALFTSIRPVLWLPRPVLLPANANFQIEANQVSGTSGRLTFIGVAAQ
jgi:hypothetical protein